jgi:anti-anti-sigma factor
MIATGSIRLVHRRQGTVAMVSGEVDLANAGRVFAVAHDDGEREMVLDLTGVRFMDSSAIHEIVLLSRTRGLKVVAPTGAQPRSVLEISHVVDVVSTYDNLALALAG